MQFGLIWLYVNELRKGMETNPAPMSSLMLPILVMWLQALNLRSMPRRRKQHGTVDAMSEYKGQSHDCAASC